MAAMSMKIEMQRRRAEITLDKTHQRALGVDKPIQLCHVLGLFQVEDGDFVAPVFVCELDTGDVIATKVWAVKFLDTEGGILL